MSQDPAERLLAGAQICLEALREIGAGEMELSGDDADGRAKFFIGISVNESNATEFREVWNSAKDQL